MKMRSLIIAMLVSSMLGGAIAITGYNVLYKPEPVAQPVPTSVAANPGTPVSFTNYIADTVDVKVPAGLNFIGAAKVATPSVVHIRTAYSANRATNSYNPFDDFFRDYFGDRVPRNREERRPQARGSGSGVIFSPDGYIVTNNHVVDDAEEIEVLLNDNRTYAAQVIGVDPNTDLAVIKIDGENLVPAQWGNSDNLQIGEWVLAVGNPYEFRSTVTAGIVSAKARNINILRSRNPRSNLSIEAFIQTDAAVNPGNSGGALVNLKGELVGINTAIASPTGSFAGYSFAVPVTLVQKVANDLVEYGAVQRALLGVSIVNVSAELAEREGLDVLKGIYVAAVQDNSSAQEAGIEEGDVIVAIDGREVNNVSELQEQVALNRPGDRIDVTYIRDGRESSVKAELKNTFGTTEVVAVSSNSFTTEGATFADLSAEEKSESDLENGVKIEKLQSGKWKEAGIKEGFIVTKIDRREIEDIDDLIAAVERPNGEGMLIEGYYPNGEKAFYGIGW